MAKSPDDLLSTLQELYRDKLTLRERHVAVARHVDHYDYNNTYQYTINREDVHLAWLETAIRELGATPEGVPSVDLPSPGKKNAFVGLVQEDARTAAALVEKWRPRVGAISNIRHAKMVGVILGETLEHRRFFAQIAEGHEGVLGRRMPGAGTGNGVMGVRWVE